MKNPKAERPTRSIDWTKRRKAVADVMKASTKPAMIAIPVVVAVWCLGRLLETLHGNAVFDAMSTYWLGVVVGLLLILWLVGLGIRCSHKLKTSPSRIASAGVWTLFFALVAIVLWRIEGFQIAAAGLLATAGGSPESAQNAVFLLMKYHPANPMLSINLSAQAVSGAGWDVASLAAYAWHWNTLLFLYLWSFVFGTGLLFRSGIGFMKTLHLITATSGLAALIFLKSKSLITTEHIIGFQAAALLLLLLQVLMIYASLRRAAAEDVDPPSDGDAKPFGGLQRPQRLPKFNYCGLPPSAIAITLSLFFMLPILADLKYQAQLAYHTRQLVENMNLATSDNDSMRVAVAPLSIRSGPSLGDDVLGVLPKGARISVQDEKFGWVHMGQNHWVPEKYLRPVVQEKHISLVGNAKTPS
jgi:hypothetical protein